MCNLHQQFRVSHNSGRTSLSMKKQQWSTYRRADRLSSQAVIYLTRISFSSGFFPCYSLPLRNLPLLHQLLIWGQKAKQPALEITLIAWAVVFNTNQVSSPVRCGSWQIVSLAQPREWGWREMNGQIPNEALLALRLPPKTHVLSSANAAAAAVHAGAANCTHSSKSVSAMQWCTGCKHRETAAAIHQ